MLLARVFRAGLAGPSRGARKIPGPSAARREAARRSTPPEIYRATANTRANRRAVVRSQREWLKRTRRDEWTAAGTACSAATPRPTGICGLWAVFHGWGAALGPAGGIANPYLVRVARP